jgi:hypothetical protein
MSLSLRAASHCVLVVVNNDVRVVVGPFNEGSVEVIRIVVDSDG